MKAYIKRISALVLVAVSCLVLCSCSAIKEMRQEQAFYGENGEIIWGGQVYMQLDILSELPEELELNTSGWGRVTAKDVPVLLSKMFGEDMYYNHNKTMLEMEYSSYYAREDVYDYVEDLIKYPYISDYCIEIEDEWTLETGYELLKERYLNAIDEIIYGGNELSPDYDEEYVVWTDSASIYKCDEKMIFQSLAYRIEELENGDMILTRFTDTYDAYVIQYRVPDDKKAMMKELLTLGEDELN
ncbi:MAG: hypothetical protein IJ027_00890 [Oscillospiraceae bacterium]|nr:hypothetical protein [Oscillospiraceae bacterium]